MQLSAKSPLVRSVRGLLWAAGGAVCVACALGPGIDVPARGSDSDGFSPGDSSGDDAAPGMGLDDGAPPEGNEGLPDGPGLGGGSGAGGSGGGGSGGGSGSAGSGGDSAAGGSDVTGCGGAPGGAAGCGG